MPLALAGFCACGGMRPLRPRIRPPEATSPTNGAVVVRVKIKGGRFSAFQPFSATFQRLGPDGKAEEGSIVSNFRSQENVYLLDLPPGRYAPVSIRYMQQNIVHDISLEPKASKDLAVDVHPGELAFAGALAFKVGGRFLRNAALLDSSRAPAAESSALEAALLDLEATLWEDMVSRRLSDLGPSRDPVLEKGKEVPRVAGGNGKFTYVDVLRWGPSVRVKGGLEWREPKGHARIAAVFQTRGMEGFVPAPEQLRQLRTVGSPEDSHRVDNVKFCSRPGYKVRYTTYYYPQGTMVGSLVKVYVTQTLMVPEPEGVFLLHYRAEKEHFERFYPLFDRFQRMLVLRPLAPSHSPPPRGGE
ncbi:MAG: hypothetical protein HY927_13515 [Elusimicrobia bacterium]|nr:hypothetical protein [Elusimicrobiota bacterium]